MAAPSAATPAPAAPSARASAFPRTPTAQVRSESRPGLIYEVSPDHCPCEDFTFRHGRDPEYRCKHLRKAWPDPAPAPAVFWCASCTRVPALPDHFLCGDCKGRAARKAAQAAQRPLARAIDFAAEQARVAASNAKAAALLGFE